LKNYLDQVLKKVETGYQRRRLWFIFGVIILTLTTVIGGLILFLNIILRPNIYQPHKFLNILKNERTRLINQQLQKVMLENEMLKAQIDQTYHLLQQQKALEDHVSQLHDSLINNASSSSQRKNQPYNKPSFFKRKLQLAQNTVAQLFSKTKLGNT